MKKKEQPKRAKITWTGQKDLIKLVRCNRCTLWKALVFLNNEKHISQNGRAPGKALAQRILTYAADKLTPHGKRRAQMVAEGRVKELK